MKLWTVTVSDEAVVFAETEADARRIANANRSDMQFEADDVEVLTTLPGHWDVDAIPYSEGNKENRSIADLVAAGMAPEHVALNNRLAQIRRSK